MYRCTCRLTSSKNDFCAEDGYIGAVQFDPIPLLAEPKETRSEVRFDPMMLDLWHATVLTPPNNRQNNAVVPEKQFLVNIKLEYYSRPCRPCLCNHHKCRRRAIRKALDGWHRDRNKLLLEHCLPEEVLQTIEWRSRAGDVVIACSDEVSELVRQMPGTERLWSLIK